MHFRRTSSLAWLLVAAAAFAMYSSAQECYWSKCEIKKVQGDCAMVHEELTECEANVSQKYYRWSLTSGEVHCANGSCCLASSTPSYAVCVRVGPECRCNNLHALSCLIQPKKKSCRGPSTAVPAMTTVANTTTNVIYPTTRPTTSSAAPFTSVVLGPFTSAGLGPTTTTDGVVYNAGPHTTVSAYEEPETTELFATSQVAQYDDIPGPTEGDKNELMHRPKERAITFTRGIIEDTELISFAFDPMTSDDPQVLFEEVEDSLRAVGIRDAGRRGNRTRFYSERNIEAVTRHVKDCNEHSGSLDRFSAFSVNYTFARPDEPRPCAGFFVAASQFTGKRKLRRNFAPQESPRSPWDAKRSFKMLPEDSPFLAVSAYSTHDLAKQTGKLQYGARFSLAQVIAEQFLSYMDELAPGEKVFMHDADFICGYYDTESMRFSTYGCRRVETDTPDEVACVSNHTSVFAIMLSVQATVVPIGVQICSYVTESVSVFFLCLTIVVLETGITTGNADRLLVQRNTALSLMLLHVASLLHDLALNDDVACFILAVLSHYFLCSTGGWMLVEGIRILIVTSDHALLYRAKSLNRKRLISLLLGWGVPGLIVGAAVAVGLATGTYMEPCYLYEKQLYALELDPDVDIHWVRKYDKCWLAPETYLFVASVIVPIATVLGLNLIITAKVTATVIKIKNRSKKLRNEDDNKGTIKGNVLSAVRALLVLIPVLGIPWIIGFFTGYGDYESSVIIMYVNAVVNGLQGMIIFVLCCCANAEVRKNLANWIKNPGKATLATTNASHGTGQPPMNLSNAASMKRR